MWCTIILVQNFLLKFGKAVLSSLIDDGNEGNDGKLMLDKLGTLGLKFLTAATALTGAAVIPAWKYNEYILLIFTVVFICLPKVIHNTNTIKMWNWQGNKLVKQHNWKRKLKWYLLEKYSE